MTFDPRTATTPNFRHPIGEEPMTEIKPNMDAIRSVRISKKRDCAEITIDFGEFSDFEFAEIPLETMESVIGQLIDAAVSHEQDRRIKQAINDAMQQRLKLTGEKYRGYGE